MAVHTRENENRSVMTLNVECPLKSNGDKDDWGAFTDIKYRRACVTFTQR